MTATKAVKTSVTSTNSLSQDYTNLDDQLPQTCQVFKSSIGSQNDPEQGYRASKKLGLLQLFCLFG